MSLIHTASALLLGAAVLAAPAVRAKSVKYTYAGPNYAVAAGCLTQAMHAGFSVTLAAKLPGNFTGYVSPLSWTAQNGLHVFKNTSRGTSVEVFWIATDAAGQITQWNVQASAYNKAGVLIYAAASHNEASHIESGNLQYDEAGDWCATKAAPGQPTSGQASTAKQLGVWAQN